MLITRVAARNFRTLENFEIALNPGYCALSGKNNAGKSAVVKIIEHFLRNAEDDGFILGTPTVIGLASDKTQWASGDDMEISLSISIERECDSQLFYVVQTYSEAKEERTHFDVQLKQVFLKGSAPKNVCIVDGKELDVRPRNEVFEKFRSSPNIVYHNSTNSKKAMVYFNESFTEIFEHHFSTDDREKIGSAQKTLQNRIGKAARQHKDELEQILGKLSDKYEVELSTIEGSNARIPLQISLKDKLVGSPLQNWGSGTQNRTRVLISVLDAVHTRESAPAETKTTPVFLVEEPESFLHPSAQAEFGQVLNDLAREFNIQIIATTHSPYMLNQHRPDSNYLLERRVFRGAQKETHVIDTSGKDWMRPFAEALGVVSSEFKGWKDAFAAEKSKVVLVEGDIDKKYFELCCEKYPHIYAIPSDVEVVAYDGKDALKNTAILRFMINKFAKVFITFDLDCLKEVEASLKRIGLASGADYLPVGVAKAGYDCMEGLLPESLRKAVFSANVESVTALGSSDTSERNSARSKLKKEMVRLFEANTVPDAELGGFKELFRKIAKALA